MITTTILFSKAVYSSVDLPSLLIKITVTFLAKADHNLTNSSTAGADARQTTENETRTFMFTWGVSCLYVSGGNINLTSMNVFSLWLFIQTGEKDSYT